MLVINRFAKAVKLFLKSILFIEDYYNECGVDWLELIIKPGIWAYL